MIYTYHTKSNPFTLLTGFRFYDGHTDRTQGLGNRGQSGTKSDFDFDEAKATAYSKYNFPNYNTAVFAENIFRMNSKFSIIPGIAMRALLPKQTGIIIL